MVHSIWGEIPPGEHGRDQQTKIVWRELGQSEETEHMQKQNEHLRRAPTHKQERQRRLGEA